MNGLTLLLIALVIFVVAYIGYGGYLAKKWGIDETRKTPAETLRDDIDYCPTDAKVVLGHQFSSIAGAGPITGPIQAIAFGWLPVFLWVIVGSVFIGGVHDWGAMFASLRHDGKSIGEVIKANIGHTGKKLFNLFAWLTLVLVVAAFADICAGTFAYNPENPTDLAGAMAGTASVLFIVLAVGFGYFVYRKRMNLVISTLIGILLMVVCITVGYQFPILKLSKGVWIAILVVYIICASVLPVWILLQPRDYLCSFLLYAMLIGGVLGIVVMRPEIVMSAFNGMVLGEGASAQYLFPMLFITVACGAVSGFHSLVSSGTSSKQIRNEKDTKLIGYGAMLIEGIIAVIAIISVAYLGQQGTGTPVQQFAAGLSYFMSSFGLPVQVGTVFVTLAFSAFALTSLDTATRLGRYMFQELVEKKEGEGEKKSILSHSMVATLITVAASVGLILYGYGNIWPIFGAANQLLAGLALLAVTAWFVKMKKGAIVTLIPMVFMFVVTLSALSLLGYRFISAGNWILGVLAVALFVLAIVLIVVAAKVFMGKGNETQDTEESVNE